MLTGYFPGDTVRFAITLDSGKTYRTYRDIDSVPNPTFQHQLPYQDSITISKLVKAHLKITLLSAGSLVFEASRLRFSTTPLTSTLPDLRPGEMALYPNPAQSGSFMIAGLDKEATVSLSTLTGQSISTQTLSPDAEFSVPDLPTGLYLVKIVSPDRTKVVKWVVEW